jgi:hypothetical protein
MRYRSLFILLFLLFTPALYPALRGTDRDLLFALGFGGVASLSIGAIIAALGIIEAPSKRLYPEVSPVSRDELERRLLSLNHPEGPWEIVKGEKCDFIARWKLVDAKWWELMARAGLRIEYRGLVLLDDEKKEVGYFEEMREF